MVVGEVIEIKNAFKPNQSDDDGNQLALGSVLVRLNAGASNLGQVQNIWARPAIFTRRIPLIGEHVTIILSPVHDSSTDGVKGQGYMYFNPVNVTDDPSVHNYHDLFQRDQSKKASAKGQVKHDSGEVGYSFPSGKTIDPIQPFEGDDIIEGRLGHSIRLGSTVSGNTSNYQKSPSWMGGSNGDPIMILRTKLPDGNGTSYTVEDLGNDNASIYLATKQMLTKFKPGFKKNLDVKTSQNWSGEGQIIIDSERVIINAKSDKAFLIGATEAVITGKRVLFQDETYKVYLDELMDFLKAWLTSDKDLAMGTKQYATACGPTAVASNMADYLKYDTVEWQKFKLP